MDLSILIPVSNHLEMTRECLASLERVTHGLRWEVILVDDATTDGTREFLRGLLTARYRVIFQEEGRPQGPAACLNAAARIARASLLCTLSPAAVLMPGWIQPMIHLARRLPGAGCIGNVHREPVSGLIDYTGVLFDVRGQPADAGHSTVAPPTEVYARWPAVSPSCAVLPKTLHERLGGFEESMPLELAGIDFCLRATEAVGAAHFTANRSVIYLHGGTLDKSPDNGRAQRREIEGRREFENRWGARARAYQEWEQAQLAAENERFQIAPKTGDQQRAMQDLDAEHWEDLCRSRERMWHRCWEIAREHRRQWRQDITDGREDGWRYLRKHALRPWRYNGKRFSEALVKVAQPRPVAITKPPRYPRARHPGIVGVGNYSANELAVGHPDALLFNPPAE